MILGQRNFGSLVLQHNPIDSFPSLELDGPHLDHCRALWAAAFVEIARGRWREWRQHVGVGVWRRAHWRRNGVPQRVYGLFRRRALEAQRRPPKQEHILARRALETRQRRAAP